MQESKKFHPSDIKPRFIFHSYKGKNYDLISTVFSSTEQGIAEQKQNFIAEIVKAQAKRKQHGWISKTGTRVTISFDRRIQKGYWREHEEEFTQYCKGGYAENVPLVPVVKADIHDSKTKRPIRTGEWVQIGKPELGTLDENTDE